MNNSKPFALALGLTLLLPAMRAGAVQGPAFSAVVDSSGTLARGFKAKTAIHLSTGKYDVRFKSDVTACAYTAAIGLSGTSGTEQAGTVNVISRANKPNGVLVQTFDMTGTRADRGFHLIINC